MKTRSGVPEAKAFGPAKHPETWWLVILKNPTGCALTAMGATAFAACAALGVTLGDVLDIKVKGNQ